MLLAVFILVAAPFGLLRAQDTAMPVQSGTASLADKNADWSSLSDAEVALRAIESIPPIPFTQLSESDQLGTFYSAQHSPVSPEPWPPLPVNIKRLPVWSLGTNNQGNGIFLLDDLAVNYNWTSTAPSKTVSGGQAMDEGSAGGGIAPSFSFSTSSLWLQITGVTNGMANLILNNATDQVYEVMSKTDLTLTNWTIEQGEVWPTNSSAMPFTVPVLDRTNALFIWARDWTGITENGNTTPDWWFWEYFGTLDLSDTNLDS